MLRRLGSHFRNQWAGFLALFLVLTGGVAYAANTVFSSDIVDGQVKNPDLAANAVTSPKIADGHVGFADLVPAARGARAYGHVSAGGVLSRSKNVEAVARVGSGRYCIDPGAGINAATAVLLVAPDFATNITSTSEGWISEVEWDSTSPTCTGSEALEVRTFELRNDSVDNNTGSGDTTGDWLLADDEPFAFVIP